MNLDIIPPPGALSWAPTRYRPVEPPTEEYGRRACEAGREVWRRYIDYMAERGMTDAPVMEIAFLETVGDERDGRSIAKAGFYSYATPYRIYIVTDKAPLDEVAWWVRHEVAHAIQFLLQGAASAGPRGEALADEMAGPDVPAGHAEWQALTADRLVMLPPSWLAAEILPAIEAGDETLALPDLATGITITNGKVTVKNAAGTTTVDGGEVQQVKNTTAEVVIDSSGLAITNGKLTVTNGSSVVIIDGTSDMFKIAASGTLSAAFPAAGNETDATVTLTALGSAYTVNPAMVCSMATDTANATTYRAGHFRMDPTYPAGAVAWISETSMTLSANPGTPIVTLRAVSVAANPGTTSACQYYVLAEAGI
jgi:hypothetical protein